MSTLLSTHSLSIRPDKQTLLDSVEITLQRGNRIGLIGFNGCGKSTLLSVLAKTNQPSAGSVTHANRCVIAYVEQRLPKALNSYSLTEVLLSLLPSNQHLDNLWLAEIHLAQVGFTPEQFTQRLDSLSGGEHTRLLLARALMQQPDLLLLDEPSNHLDLPTLLWLEQFLQRWAGSFVLVSHDRRLLDSVTNCSWIMRDQTLHQFQLPCTRALEAFLHQDAALEKTRLSQKKEVDRIEASAKQKAQWGKVYDNEDFARKAKHMFKRAERIKAEMNDAPQRSPWSIGLQTQALAADRLLEFSNFKVRVKPHAATLYEVDNLRVKSGDRIAIIGANGCGKSTLLKQVWQQYCDVQQGAALTIHPNCKLGFYDQEQQQLKDNDALTDAIAHRLKLPQETLKMALIKAGFEFSSHHKAVANLSGGERARLMLANLNLGHYPLLLLDEPTNHLDLDGKAQLATALSETQGAVLMVSHDRDFIESSCNRFWLVQGGQLSEVYEANQAYLELGAGTIGEKANENRPITSSLPHPSSAVTDEEAQLKQLLQLEQQLAEDLTRKPKHQKPQKQQRWRQQIEQLNQQLGLV
ncbi:ABC-F family ATP-binding cassette domain-containing protein [Ferrimonas aestuarii]|uniref:ABC-F family ATP-binding cassette domain-containing protein n=1 Tax=Ferrimonas aestuarii TaxID=2569539 RepID=A0A4U1BLF0_9GAMM|nr:ABC-F family ATP-binding cassette domain-containing protein [Ferrimonas aestuarii]TKB53358.1 ABC-F family ATP-binding cassette domain-containing protein [Ferrimonas aestuarii]